ncbi:peptidoglycan editing factor PgeF [Jeotgalibacillus proteolyticus]|uniref:Purine nucleoside phosphorylase n=1 Tax=Jeotgalibacillus proteolyticus TaxID=2082395 RepID=A0A2S5GGT7_9BACL|nr:peptidoglycan editing factor PgeF [Jeotgalibacillus proteolyticus]PPA72125.1 peptidoglycan editing factor PgeF [Jeotgalibacillus proteolyticus]
MKVTDKKSARFLTIEDWTKEIPSLVAIFSAKNGGVSSGAFSSLNLGLHVKDLPEDVISNRRILAEELDAPAANFIWADQIHGADIRKVTHNECGAGTLLFENAIPETDGLWTVERNVFLALCFADCVPLFFAEPDSGFAGAAHAGWKGTVLNIAGAMVHEAEMAGTDLSKLKCYIGPSIGSCCYEVDDFVINKVKNCLGENEHKSFIKKTDLTYSLDLKEVNKQLLINAGILESNISISSLCTSCEDDLFFSHRRDQGKTGRMAAVIGWRN